MSSEKDEDESCSRLPLEEWDAPPKKPSNNDIGSKSAKSAAELAKYVDTKYNLSYEDILKHLQEKIEGLLNRQDFTKTETRPALKFIQRQTRYNPDVFLNKRIVEKIVRFGIAHVFLRVWQSVSVTDYLGADHLPAFKNLQTTLSITWNCSDKSPTLCDSLVRCSVVQLFISELETAKLKDSDLNNEDQLYLVKAYLGILHNILRLCSDSRKVFRSANSVNVLQHYLHTRQGLVKTKAYVILAYIINENENDLINATDENIKFILGILKEALSSPNHFSQTHAFWAMEIADGLNHLAVNDANKVRMGKLGALPLYVRLLQSDNVEEQNLGAAGLWILAFKNENKVILKQEAGCVEALQSLATSSPHESIRRAARGALWVVRTVPERPLAPAVVSDADIPHVMISYHWTAQEVMLKVKDKLRDAGYKVWMDVDKMSGSTLEAMALAVERAAVVLVCMSQGYKDSPSCRTEAEYTYRLQKDVIPLLVQPSYNPDGWLGMMVGTRLHFDFSAKENIATQLPRLIKEIGLRGKLRSAAAALVAGMAVRAVGSGDDSWESLEGSGSALPSSASVSSLHSYMTRQIRVGTWTTEDVLEWLESVHLGEAAQKFHRFDGLLLLQYKKMMETAPQYFYHTLEDILQLDLVTILHFSKALETIK